MMEAAPQDAKPLKSLAPRFSTTTRRKKLNLRLHCGSNMQTHERTVNAMLRSRDRSTWSKPHLRPEPRHRGQRDQTLDNRYHSVRCTPAMRCLTTQLQIQRTTDVETGLESRLGRLDGMSFATGSSEGSVFGRRVEQCSPRVKNLQTEMDMLRKEIQKLKAMDISSMSISRTPSGTSSIKDRSEMDGVALTGKEAKRKLLRLGLDTDVLSDSEISEAETEVNPLQQSIDRPVNVCTTGMPCDDHSATLQPSGMPLSELEGVFQTAVFCSIGTETEMWECMQCEELKKERWHLLNVVREKESAIRCLEQDSEEANGIIQKYECEAATKRSRMQHVSIEAIPQTVDHSCQSIEGNIDLQNLQDSIELQKLRCVDLESINAALQSEFDQMEVMRKKADQQAARSIKGVKTTDSAGDDMEEYLIELLSAHGIQDGSVRSLAIEIVEALSSMKGAPEKMENVDIQKAIAEEKMKMEAAFLKESADREAELSDLQEEKNVLSQKVMDLRKAMKKETAEKEAVQLEASKLQHDLQEQCSMMEEHRSIVHQKRQQVSELEDSLTVLQHENESWERDYDILVRKQEQLERELRIAKNLERNIQS